MIDLKLSDPELAAPSVDKKTDQAVKKTEARQVESFQGSVGETPDGADPIAHEVAALAYQYWLERGSPHGSHEEDWLRAEDELRGRSKLSRAAQA